MDSQDGKTVLAVLFTVLVVFVIMWMAVPFLQKNSLVPNETAAIGLLRQINTAQQEMYGGSRMYGSMQRLSNSKLISQTQDSFKSGGYEFYHSAAATGRTWCAVAIPEMDTRTTSLGEPTRRSGKNFGIDETGTVYQDVSPSACYAGSLDKSGASAVK